MSRILIPIWDHQDWIRKASAIILNLSYFAFRSKRTVLRQKYNVNKKVDNVGKNQILELLIWVTFNRFNATNPNIRIAREAYKYFLFASDAIESKIFDEIVRIDNRLKTEIQKGQLNEFLMDIQMLKKPPRHNGMEIKLKFITYTNKGKPTFIIFANKPEYIHFSYKRFIENQIRQIFEFEGIPLVFKYKR